MAKGKDFVEVVGLPRGTVVKNLPDRWGFDLWVGKIPWRRKWQPLQYPCLENLMDRRARWAAVHGVAKSWA